MTARDELVLACRHYFTAKAMADAPAAGQAVVDLGSQEMEAAAETVAAIPCQTHNDLAAKVFFVLAAMEETGQLTDGELAVLTSVADALAMGGAARAPDARGRNPAPPIWLSGPPYGAPQPTREPRP